jgi:hypothetical protein
VLFELASDAVLGFPAYTTPAWPLGLNGEPGAAAELPGITGLAGPHVFVGAPGWPVVGVTRASAEAGAAIARPTEATSTSRYFRTISSWSPSHPVEACTCQVQADTTAKRVHARRLPAVHRIG